MSHPQSQRSADPGCYAVVIPGLEKITGEEIVADLGGEVKKSSPGLVVFRPPTIDASLLQLRTTEDIFLLGWGTDQLTYRSKDLDSIEHWTARKVDWDLLLRLHHGIRPRPKGKPTFRIVTQMTGEHGYRRVDARKALLKGLAGKLPASWRHAEENASVEIWLTIHGATAICGLRLSDRTMRHRPWKLEHAPASLRPTVAAAMIRLAETRPGLTLLDPMCGSGTILAEQLALAGPGQRSPVLVLGGDLDWEALRNSRANLHDFKGWHLCRWDAEQLPLPPASIDRIACNPPFGKQLSAEMDIPAFYRRLLREQNRVLRPGGRSVLLVSDWPALQAAAAKVEWKEQRKLGIRVLGQRATISVWRKPKS